MSKEYNMEIGSFLRFAMENAKKHWLKFFVAIFGTLIAMLLIVLIGFNISDTIGTILVFVVSICASFGLFANVIRLSSGRSFDLKVFLPEFGVMLNYFLGMLVVSIIVSIGLVLLIVPGIILGIMLSLVPFLIIDKKMNFVVAMKESMRLTSGHKMDIFIGMFITNIVVMLLSIPVITLFFTIPMQVFVQAYPYAQLTGLLKEEDKVEKEVEQLETIVAE